MTQRATTRPDKVVPYDGDVPLFEEFVDGPWHGVPLPPERFWNPFWTKTPAVLNPPANRYGRYHPELVDGMWRWTWKKRPYGYRRKMEPLP